jgi:hypothetical protein
LVGTSSQRATPRAITCRVVSTSSARLGRGASRTASQPIRAGPTVTGHASTQGAPTHGGPSAAGVTEAEAVADGQDLRRLLPTWVPFFQVRAVVALERRPAGPMWHIVDLPSATS